MDVFAALADPLRRDILRRLADGPARVVDLTRGHHVSRPAISRHLRLLLQAGLVQVTPTGRERHYRLSPERLGGATDYLRDLQDERGGGEQCDHNGLAAGEPR